MDEVPLNGGRRTEQHGPLLPNPLVVLLCRRIGGPKLIGRHRASDPEGRVGTAQKEAHPSGPRYALSAMPEGEARGNPCER
jgi:hypothetical protein